jgi:predicted alpha/beta hydrolase
MVWDGGRGYVGPATAVDADTVVRDLTVANGSAPAVGAMAAHERAYWLGSDPSSIGLEWTDVSVAGPDGPLPAWSFPAVGDQTTMAIVAHGQNGSRLDGLRVVDTLHHLGMPALVVTYRNDAGAPADASGQLGYGATEWPDLQAAVSWAIEHGASDIVLVGQSMGGGVVAAFLENSPQAAEVSRVVLDAPMLSLVRWSATGHGPRCPSQVGRSRPPVIWAAEQIASLRFGLDWSAVDYLDETAWVRVPTLVVHGLDDPSVPATVSQELATGVPDLVMLTGVPTSTARGVVEYRPHEVDAGRHPVPQL